MIRRDNDAMGAFCCASVTSGYMGNDQDGNEWNCRGSALICTAAACGRFHSSRGGSHRSSCQTGCDSMTLYC
ncbi:hypothetical protein BLNAU_20033 [Blattamonas nauphoetae]|uniref:Uncharacterized protein n=1 Tax=Blattamonas nauphoetae TaxID=2049346 RepID=A0ABQ9WZU7_9EUKA|nr:hypothetical protein BLNAU_20033 [Blattamonas nauphoetae]